MNRNGRTCGWRSRLLEGKNVNLRVAEKEDVPLLVEWFNDVRFAGDYQHFPYQITSNQLERQIQENRLYGHEWVDFIVEKKDGNRIGWVVHYISAPNFGWVEIGYSIIPAERNKGYGTEAIQVITDYLFLTKKAITRIQAVVDIGNLASKHALENCGYKKEGVLRKALWNAIGDWTDGCLYSILREEWKEPRMLTSTVSRS
jgi:RimJ/RimL family protein N-acetyltransferase